MFEHQGVQYAKSGWNILLMMPTMQVQSRKDIHKVCSSSLHQYLKSESQSSITA